MKTILGVLKHHGYAESGGGNDEGASGTGPVSREFTSYNRHSSSKEGHHNVYVRSGGHWEHHNFNNQTGDSSAESQHHGQGPESLHHYLTGVHGKPASQHSEEPNPNEVMLKVVVEDKPQPMTAEKAKAIVDGSPFWNRPRTIGLAQ